MLPEESLPSTSKFMNETVPNADTIRLQCTNCPKYDSATAQTRMQNTMRWVRLAATRADIRKIMAPH